MKYYSVVTFGAVARSVHQIRQGRSEARAIRSAVECKGSGSCSMARVYECDTLALARTADVSQIRPGERIVYST